MGYDFSRITDRLFIGGQINTQAEIDEIHAAGITHIINAQVEHDDRKTPGDWHFIQHLWNPTPDDGQPKPVEWFKPAIVFGIAALSAPGNRVLAHCAAGVNRGPSLGYAVLRAQGFGDALAWIKVKRPFANVAYARDADAALKTLGWI